MPRSAPLAAALALACALPGPAHAASGRGRDLPPEPGAWWDITTEMVIRGPNVPPQAQKQTSTQRECLPKKIPDRPPNLDDECSWVDYRRSGPRVTFKLKCPNGLSGEADLLWTSDTYSGTTVMRGQGMENRITAKGKKVGGDCDANADLRKEREEAEAAARGQAEGEPQACAFAAENGELARFLPSDGGEPAECGDAGRYCAALETRQGLLQLRLAGLDDARQQAGKLCKKDLSAVERRLCAAAAKEPERRLLGEEELSEFVFASCPDVSRGLAKKACAGRSFTGMSEARRGFCVEWAQEALQRR